MIRQFSSDNFLCCRQQSSRRSTTTTTTSIRTTTSAATPATTTSIARIRKSCRKNADLRLCAELQDFKLFQPFQTSAAFSLAAATNHINHHHHNNNNNGSNGRNLPEMNLISNGCKPPTLSDMTLLASSNGLQVNIFLLY